MLFWVCAGTCWLRTRIRSPETTGLVLLALQLILGIQRHLWEGTRSTHISHASDVHMMCVFHSPSLTPTLGSTRTPSWLPLLRLCKKFGCT